MPSFRDWSDEEFNSFVSEAETNIFQSGVIGEQLQYLGDEQYEEAQELFEAGWLTFGEYSKEQLDNIRDDFYDLLGIQEDQFDWQEYRDLYSEAG